MKKKLKIGKNGKLNAIKHEGSNFYLTLYHKAMGKKPLIAEHISIDLGAEEGKIFAEDIQQKAERLIEFIDDMLEMGYTYEWYQNKYHRFVNKHDDNTFSEVQIVVNSQRVYVAFDTDRPMADEDKGYKVDWQAYSFKDLLNGAVELRADGDIQQGEVSQLREGGLSRFIAKAGENPWGVISAWVKDSVFVDVQKAENYKGTHEQYNKEQTDKLIAEIKELGFKYETLIGLYKYPNGSVNKEKSFIIWDFNSKLSDIGEFMERLAVDYKQFGYVYGIPDKNGEFADRSGELFGTVMYCETQELGGVYEKYKNTKIELNKVLVDYGSMLRGGKTFKLTASGEVDNYVEAEFNKKGYMGAVGFYQRRDRNRQSFLTAERHDQWLRQDPRFSRTQKKMTLAQFLHHMRKRDAMITDKVELKSYMKGRSGKSWLD